MCVKFSFYIVKKKERKKKCVCVARGSGWGGGGGGRAAVELDDKVTTQPSMSQI